MDVSVRQLRVQARQLTRGKAPRAVRYPAEFRAAALALARPRVRRGVAIARVARDLGLAPQCLGRWLQTPAAATPLRRVAVAVEPAAPRPPAGLVLVTSPGHRVEGLDGVGLIAVLRALA